jgi:hypothetical protein
MTVCGTKARGRRKTGETFRDDLYECIGNFDGAITDYTQVIRLYPNIEHRRNKPMKKRLSFVAICFLLCVYSVSADMSYYAGPEFEFGTLSVLGIGIGAAEIGYTSNFSFFNFGVYADLMGGLGMYKDEGVQISDWGSPLIDAQGGWWKYMWDRKNSTLA